jgi:hypothetical protein
MQTPESMFIGCLNAPINFNGYVAYNFRMNTNNSETCEREGPQLFLSYFLSNPPQRLTYFIPSPDRENGFVSDTMFFTYRRILRFILCNLYP